MRLISLTLRSGSENLYHLTMLPTIERCYLQKYPP
jgi:hypothetical protein